MTEEIAVCLIQQIIALIAIVTFKRLVILGYILCLGTVSAMMNGTFQVVMIMVTVACLILTLITVQIVHALAMDSLRHLDFLKNMTTTWT